MMNKYIGILGGIGYRATMLAYNKLNQLYEQKKGVGHSCPIRLTSIDFKEINDLLPYQIEEAAEKLSPFLLEMDKQDVVANIMVNNTLHEAFDILSPELALKKPFGHVGELLLTNLQEKPPESVMLIGTMYTMNSRYLESFIPHNMEVVKADAHLQIKLEELRISYFEKDNQELAEACYNLLIQSYRHVDKIIVACTEHSLAFAPYTDNSSWIDTMDLQCEFALKHLF